MVFAYPLVSGKREQAVGFLHGIAQPQSIGQDGLKVILHRTLSVFA
jgi:hypothetical protein